MILFGDNRGRNYTLGKNNAFPTQKRSVRRLNDSGT